MNPSQLFQGPGLPQAHAGRAHAYAPHMRGAARPYSFTDAMRTVVPFILFILLLLAGVPSLLRFVFPLATTLVGYSLYRRHEAYYLSFILWICMLAPLLRRIVDWRSSYQEQSLILLAPLLVTLIPLIDVRRRLLSIDSTVRAVTLLAFAGIAYGFGIGMIRHPGVSVVLAAATWIGPISLCIFTASIREREELPQVLTRTLLVGVVLMSLYSFYQYIVAPPWDTFWLRNIIETSIAPSFGNPVPYGIRVWSTMNAPGPYSLFMSAALIWLATRETVLTTVVSLLGYSALLLTLVRSSWIVTAIGIMLLVFGCRPRKQIRGLLVLFLMLGALTYGVIHLSQADSIQKRLQTFTNLKSDDSANERKDLYRYMAGVILSTPAGDGLDTAYDFHGYPLDSSLILLGFRLGWVGAGCYFTGYLLIITRLMTGFRSGKAYQVAAAAIVFALLTQSTGGDVVCRQGGVLLWLFLGVWGCLEHEPVTQHLPAMHSHEKQTLIPDLV